MTTPRYMGLLPHTLIITLVVLIISLSHAREGVAQSTLLVNSSGNHSIQKFDGALGTPLGSFTALNESGLSQPRGLAFGPDGNLYAASRATNRILRYDGLSGAFIDAFVADDPAIPGNQTGGLQDPTGLVFGPDGNLYVSSGETDSVIRYDGSTGAFIDNFVTTQRGGLDRPRGLAFGPDGNLYVSSFNANGIFRYSGLSGAFIDAFVIDNPATPNNETGGLQNPIGLAFGPSGDLFVCSFSNNVVFRYNGLTGAPLITYGRDLPGTPNIDESSGLDGPISVVVGADGDLYVSSFFTNQVLRFDVLTREFLGPFVSDNPATPGLDEAGGLNRPTEFIFGPDGNLYISSREINSILRFNGITGAFIDTLASPPNGNLLNPVGLAVGPDGNVYVSSSDTNAILRYNRTTGAFIDTFVADLPSTPAVDESGGLNSPTGLTFGADGNLYVSSFRSDRVLQYNGVTGAFIKTFVARRLGGLRRPTGLVFGPDSHLYVSSFDTHSVFRYDGVSGAFINAFITDNPTTPANETGGLRNPVGLVFGPGGRLYVNSFGNNVVFLFNGITGNVISTYVANRPNTPQDESGGLLGPTWLSFGPDDNLYISSSGTNSVLRYAGGPGVTGPFIDAFIPSGSGNLRRPGGLVFLAP